MATVEELQKQLDRLGVASASELIARLATSQPTLSRLVRSAGERIAVLGRLRGTRYATTRTVGSLGRRVPLHRVDEAGQLAPAGEMLFLSGGRHWVIDPTGKGRLYEGLPEFAVDMSPQGYLGRSFPQRYPELHLPERITDWSDDHRLIAIATRGEDCTGDLIVGAESLSRWLASKPIPATPEHYPKLAQVSAYGEPGSSAAGEHPKFTAFVEGRQVLVKFAGAGDDPNSRRWRDLLLCESLALEAVARAGYKAAKARTVDVRGERFLEVDRFDRVGERGRQGLVSLFAVDIVRFGQLGSWTAAVLRLADAQSISAEDARAVRWLDAFGQLIGNTDRHLGNLSFFPRPKDQLELAPIYDMLPMIFAPRTGGLLVEPQFAPAPPNADNLDVWPSAAQRAVEYWEEVSRHDELAPDLREHARRFGEAVARALESAPRLAPTARGSSRPPAS